MAQLAEKNIKDLVKWKWGATCYVRYKDDNWEIFEWASPEISQPTNDEIKAEIPNYQSVLDDEETAAETAKTKKTNDRASGIAKLKAGTWSPLSDDEATALFGE